MRRMRITVRQSMIAIAILGVVLWAVQTGWRWYVYQRQAASHAQAMADCLAGIAACEPNIARARREFPEKVREARQAPQIGDLRFRYTVNGVEKTVDDYVANLEEYITTMDRAGKNTQAMAGYHARLMWKYQNAVARPWLQVAPDPPVPQSVADLEEYRSPMDEALIARLRPTLPPTSMQPLESIDAPISDGL